MIKVSRPFALMAIALVAGCQEPLEIREFAATPSSLLRPGAVNVTWSVAGAVEIELDGSPLSKSEGQFSLHVNPPKTLTLAARREEEVIFREIIIQRDEVPVDVRVIDRAGVPVTGVALRIGAETLTTDQTGQARFAAVALPYDVCVSAAGGGALCYANLSSTAPFLTFVTPPEPSNLTRVTGIAVSPDGLDAGAATTFVVAQGSYYAPFTYSPDQVFDFAIGARHDGVFDLLAYRAEDLPDGGYAVTAWSEALNTQSDVENVDAGVILIEPIESDTVAFDVVGPEWDPDLLVGLEFHPPDKEPTELIPARSVSGAVDLAAPRLPRGYLVALAIASVPGPSGCSCSIASISRRAVIADGVRRRLAVPSVPVLSPSGGSAPRSVHPSWTAAPGFVCVASLADYTSLQNGTVRVVTDLTSVDPARFGFRFEAGHTYGFELNCYGPFGSIDDAVADDRFVKALNGRGTFDKVKPLAQQFVVQ